MFIVKLIIYDLYLNDGGSWQPGTAKRYQSKDEATQEARQYKGERVAVILDESLEEVRFVF